MPRLTNKKILQTLSLFLIIYIFACSYDLIWLIFQDELKEYINCSKCALRVPNHPFLGSIILFILSISILYLNRLLGTLWICSLIVINYFAVVNYIINQFPVNTEVLNAILNSNPKESFEFIHSSWAVIIPFSILLIIVLLSIFRLIFTSKIRLNTIQKLPILVVLTIIAIFFKQNYYNVYNLYFPLSLANATVDLFRTSGKNKDRIKEIEKYPITIYDAKNKPINIILVLGESSRKDFWELYGSLQKNNPLLKERDVILYESAYSNATSTFRAVPLVLSKNTSETFDEIYSTPSITSYFNKANFQTFYLNADTRPHFKLPLSILDSYRFEADQYFYSHYNDQIGKIAYDLNLSQKLKSLSPQFKDKNFVILQTSGSHTKYDERYPKDLFPPMDNGLDEKETLINQYLNTIRYTDIFLDDVFSFVDQLQVPTIVLYISDHGENFYDDSRQLSFHGTFSTQFLLEVPFIIYANDEYKKEYKREYSALEFNRKKRIESQDLFHTLIALGNFTSKDKLDQYVLVDTSYQPRDKHLIYDPYIGVNNIIDYDSVLAKDAMYKKSKYYNINHKKSSQ